MRDHKHTPEAICDRYHNALCAMAERRGVLPSVSDLMRAYNEGHATMRKAEQEHDAAQMEYDSIWEPSKSDDRKMELADLRYNETRSRCACYRDYYDRAESALLNAGMTYAQSYNLLCDLL